MEISTRSLLSPNGTVFPMPSLVRDLMSRIKFLNLRYRLICKRRSLHWNMYASHCGYLSSDFKTKRLLAPSYMCVRIHHQQLWEPGRCSRLGWAVKRLTDKTSITDILHCSQLLWLPYVAEILLTAGESLLAATSPKERSEVQLCGHHGEGGVQGRLREANQGCSLGRRKPSHHAVWTQMTESHCQLTGTVGWGIHEGATHCDF